MALVTGPQRLLELFEDEWQATRAGRADVPDIIKRTTQGENPNLNDGVLPVRDREEVAVDQAKHDLLHCYHPEGNPPTVTDNGFKEQNVVETVQIDLDITDRTDHALNPPDARLSARERMTGLRGDLAAFDDPPYGGIAGETVYILETVRRGLDEWDTVSYDFVNVYLGNSNATISLNVELEQIARNTVV